MKIETLIYEKVREIIPAKSEKTIFFAAISRTSYEVFFYSFINGIPKQCFELAEEGKMDENVLNKAFGEIVDIIRDSKQFIVDKYNIATIRIDKTGIKIDIEYYDRNVRMYKIKKEWANQHIG